MNTSDHGPRGEAEALFFHMFPGYFDAEFIKNLPEDDSWEEMTLPLAGYEAHDVPVPAGVTFGFYEGPGDRLRAAVAEVDESWLKYYPETSRPYCAFAGEEIASFCLIEDFGAHPFTGREMKFGGPGCVGTVPRFRRRGIGLKMVDNATLILKDRGFDVSYIHYTGVGGWYAKLGYRTLVRWNGRGIVRA